MSSGGCVVIAWIVAALCLIVSIAVLIIDH